MLLVPNRAINRGWPGSGVVSPIFSAPLRNSLVPDKATGSPTPTFTRATTKTVLGYAAGAVIADGPTLQTVASGEAAFMGARRLAQDSWSLVDANGVALTTTNGASALCCDANGPFGYFAEGARTNRCLQSQEFDEAVWVSGGGGIAVDDQSHVAPDGTTTADTLTASGANGTLIQDLGVVASAQKTFSIWLKRKTGSGNIDITVDGGSTWHTVSVTSSWARFSRTQTLADEDVGIRIVASGDEVYAWGAQVETASFASSYIPTTSASVTRNADVLTYAAAGNLNNADGSFIAEITSAAPNGVNVDILSGSTAGNAGYITGNQMLLWDGTNTPGAVALSQPVSVMKRLGSKWGGASANAFAAGVAGTASSFDGNLTNGSANVGVGYRASDNSNYLFGTIRNVNIYGRTLSDARLQQLTT